MKPVPFGNSMTSSSISSPLIFLTPVFHKKTRIPWFLFDRFNQHVTNNWSIYRHRESQWPHSSQPWRLSPPCLSLQERWVVWCNGEKVRRFRVLNSLKLDLARLEVFAGWTRSSSGRRRCMKLLSCHLYVSSFKHADVIAMSWMV